MNTFSRLLSSLLILAAVAASSLDGRASGVTFFRVRFSFSGQGDPKGCKKPVIRTTDSGAAFTQIEDPKLGNRVWMDPTGMAWGDLETNKDNQMQMPQARAISHCAEKGKGYHLPSAADYLRLSEAMGSKTKKGYRHQLLSTLIALNFGDIPRGALEGAHFWTSSQNKKGESLLFNDEKGTLVPFRATAVHEVRCVRDPIR